MSKVSSLRKAELGAERCKHYFELRGFMHRAGFETIVAFADFAGTSDAAVNRTLKGSLHTPEVLNALRECNAPEALLFDPLAQG